MAVIAAALLLALPAYAFPGESAAVSTLLDFLLKKDLKKVGDDLAGNLMTICQRYYVTLLMLNPNTMEPGVLNITKYFIAVLVPLFVFAIIVSGIYLIFFSGSPDVRSKIKSILPGIIASMVLAMLSPHILNALFYVSESLFNGVISQGPKNAIGILLPHSGVNPVTYFMTRFQNLTWYSSEASAPFLFLSLLLLGGLLLVVIARYLIISVFAMIFPVTIFLYLFLPSRQIGRRIMEQTLMWIFLQVIEAVTLVSVSTIIVVFSPFLIDEVLVLLEIGGLLTLIFVPVAAVVFFRDFLPG